MPLTYWAHLPSCLARDNASVREWRPSLFSLENTPKTTGYSRGSMAVCT
nr:MAG TPA_asm: hypothetical protein [Caudoviricetes sp.]